MYVLHTFLVVFCFAVTRTSAGYEVINNEIIERIDLDNGQDLQLLATSGKTSPKKNSHVDKMTPTGRDGNSVQGSHESLGIGVQQPSIIYAAIQALPHMISTQNGQGVEKKVTPPPMETTEKPGDYRKPHNKLEDPSEDKTKDIKTKLYSYFKPKGQLNVEIQSTQDNPVETDASTGEVATMRTVIVQPYATIIDDVKDLRAEQSEEPYVVYDKQDYLKPKHVKKTVKTHKIGDEKKSVYPKEEIRVATENKEKDDMETDNTIWIGYGLGVPTYRYPYTYPSTLYSNYYGRPYSGWTRGYTGNPYYDNLRTSLQSGYTGSAYDNYGTGFGPYGGYL